MRLSADDAGGDPQHLGVQRSAMNGSAISSEMKIARIFGTKTRVISWIWVSACSSEMTTPTAKPTSMTGLETTMSVKIASRATSRTSGPVIDSLSAPACGDQIGIFMISS